MWAGFHLSLGAERPGGGGGRRVTPAVNTTRSLVSDMLGSSSYIVHNFLSHAEFPHPCWRGGAVSFFFSITTEQELRFMCNSLVGTGNQGRLGGRGLECFCLNIGRQMDVPLSHLPSARTQHAVGLHEPAPGFQHLVLQALVRRYSGGKPA